MQERQTKQKQIIYDALMALDHPTATEVFGYVHTHYPTISRATVFRVLNGFTNTGKALGLRSAGDEVRYDFRIEPHFHAHCKTCGRVSDIQAEGEISPKKCHGFSIEGYSVEFFGTCKECSAQ